MVHPAHRLSIAIAQEPHLPLPFPKQCVNVGSHSLSTKLLCSVIQSLLHYPVPVLGGVTACGVFQIPALQTITTILVFGWDQAVRRPSQTGESPRFHPGGVVLIVSALAWGVKPAL